MHITPYLIQILDNLLLASYRNTRTTFVTAKMATSTKVDSELNDAHLESLKRREGKGKCH